MLKFNDSIIDLSREEYKRYARHLIIDQIGINGQKRLKQAKILLIGAGGLACPAILYLVTSGIGSLGIVDDDTVSLSNLHRQILYSPQDINQLKTICLKKIQEINPYCEVKIYSYKLNKYNALDLIKIYDIILDTTDNFETRYVIDKTCYKLHKIHIYGAIQNFEGQVSVFNYKNGPRYSEIYPNRAGLVTNNCNEIGVLSIVPGIIGILQATEAIKIILGVGEILSGNILVYNSLNMSFKKIKIQNQISKQVIGSRYNKYTSKKDHILSVYELQKKMIYNESIMLVDVRQKKEFKTNYIKNAINLPLITIKQKKNIDLINRNSFNKTIVIYCSENSRSITASKILNTNNIKHYRLQDGLNSWLSLV
uniref:Probable molybdopterin-synthase adenylyltransferase n=1 Tax=Mastocarpus papillatus TaxID=31436 RepID=A0A342RZD5_9FLOR|nr:molybdopterin biosynthesis protein [Mastocarpus papillatus]AOL58081.1 molybdopterin biosynthesis protein [Mastocarpus papillatus]